MTRVEGSEKYECPFTYFALSEASIWRITDELGLLCAATSAMRFGDCEQTHNLASLAATWPALRRQAFPVSFRMWATGHAGRDSSE